MALKPYLELAKARIVLLSALLAALGHALADAGSPAGLAVAVLGTSLAVASASAFNMLLEKDTDGRMARTRRRPLPAGAISPAAALRFASAAGILGLACLAALSTTAFAVGALALVVYAFVYTPLKRRTPWAFLAGVGPGAAPPLMGWAAAADSLDGAGLLLFLWLLVWQVPHIMAIYCVQRKDYAAAGIPVATDVWGERPSLILALPFTAGTLVLAALLGRATGAGAAFQALLLLLGAAFLAGHARALLGRNPSAGAAGLKRGSIAYAAGVTFMFLAIAAF